MRKCVVSLYMYLRDKRNVINFIFFSLSLCLQDPYINRLLPLLIGTPKFMEDDCVGLAEEESGTVVFWFKYTCILDSQHTMKLGTSTQTYFCFPYCISSESHKALQVFLIKSFSPVWHRQKKCYFENNSVQQQLGCSVFLFHIMYQIFSKTLITWIAFISHSTVFSLDCKIKPAYFTGKDSHISICSHGGHLYQSNKQHWIGRMIGK